MQEWIKKMPLNNTVMNLFKSAGSKYNHSRGSGHDTLVKKMNQYFSGHPGEAINFKRELEFIQNKSSHLPTEEERERYSIYPYPFVLTYDHRDIRVFMDEEAKMFYTHLEGKRLYFHKGFTTKEDVQKHFVAISAEQDIESPHRYFNDSFSVSSEDVVADLGAAEGNFSLMAVDKVKELFILEADPVWTEALYKTFEPWREKVHIINKYAGDRNDANTVTLNELFKEKKLSVLKMDIEGAEMSVLKSSESVIRNNDLKMVITTYHRKNDAGDIKKFLENCEYVTSFSKNFMLFVWDDLTPPYFRKVLIMASKGH